eukprot:8053593-Lingulodinium_polyedra.AAC.1
MARGPFSTRSARGRPNRRVPVPDGEVCGGGVSGGVLPAGGSLRRGQGRFSLRAAALRFWQLRVAERFRQRFPSCRPPPDPSSSREAFWGLLRSDDLVAAASGASFGFYSADMVRVIRADLYPQEIAEPISPEAAAFTREPRRFILKSEVELAADVDSGGFRGRFYWDPALK